jgi:hypothetical protein
LGNELFREVKEEASTHVDYQEARKSLEKDEENSHDTLSQEQGVLDHRPRF